MTKKLLNKIVITVEIQFNMYHNSSACFYKTHLLIFYLKNLIRLKTCQYMENSNEVNYAGLS